MRHDLLWLSVSNRSQRGSPRSLRRARKHFVFDGTWRFFCFVFSKVRFLRFVNINIVHTLTCVVLVSFSFFSSVIIKLCARKIKVPFIFGFSIKLISFKLKQKKKSFSLPYELHSKKCFAPFDGVAPTISAGDRTAVFLLSQLWLSAVYIVSVKSFHTRINYWKRKIKLLKIGFKYLYVQLSWGGGVLDFSLYRWGEGGQTQGCWRIAARRLRAYFSFSGEIFLLASCLYKEEWLKILFFYKRHIRFVRMSANYKLVCTHTLCVFFFCIQ